MNRQEKEIEVTKLAEKFTTAKAIIFAGFQGLKVSEMGELRTSLRKEKATLKVIKNRLAKRVLGEQGKESLGEFIDGPTAITASELDPVSTAKVLVEFAKTHERLILRGGYVEGKPMTLKAIEFLAKLPSREVLLAKALGSLQAPASNFVGVLAALPRKLVRVVDAIKATKS